MRYQPPHSEGVGVGRFEQDHYDQPDLIASTVDGTKIELCGIRLDRFPQINHDLGGKTTFSYCGTVLSAVVEISRDRLLAFDNSTEEPNRLFFSGSTGFSHSLSDPVKFVARDGSSTETCRVSTPLSAIVSLVGAHALVKHAEAGWLAYKGNLDDRHLGGTPEQLFVSFLNGHNIPFHWRDRRNGDVIERTYYGWQVQRYEHYEGIMTLPIDGIEAADFGKEVLQMLPALFEGFCDVLTKLDLAQVLNSMWIARESYIDHQMALMSVGIEQVLSEWGKVKKSSGGGGGLVTFWGDDALNKFVIEKTLIPAVDAIVDDNQLAGLSVEQKGELRKALKSRIRSAWRPTNANVLSGPFVEAGLTLSRAENDALDRRNRALHGESLDYPLQVDDLNEYSEDFETLCMLITKLVLKLTEYKGPYRNFASRPINSNFEIKRM